MSKIFDKIRRGSAGELLSPSLWRKGMHHMVDEWHVRRMIKGFYEAGDGVAPPPRLMVFEVTVRCNLRCTMCYLTEEIRTSKPASELTLDQIGAILADIDIRDVNLVGGEVFIRQDIFDILALLRDNGRHCPTLTTNGTLLSPHRAKRLVPFMLDGTVGSLTFSIDGPEEIHDAVRGEGTFRRTLAGMRNVLAAAEEAGQALPQQFNVNIAPSEFNYRRFDEVADVVAGLNVGYINVNHLIFHTPAETRATLRLLGETDESVLQSGVDAVPQIECQDLIETLHRLEQKAAAHGIATGTRPPMEEEMIPVTYGGKFWPNARCLWPYWLLRVQSNGTVYFCQNIRVVMGDLKTQSLDEIWNSPKFCRCRKLLLERKILPICKRCCRIEAL